MKKFFAIFLLANLVTDSISAAVISTASLTPGGTDLVTWNSWKGQSFSIAEGQAPVRVIAANLTMDVVMPNRYVTVRVVGANPGDGTPNMEDIRAELFTSQQQQGAMGTQLSFEAPPDQILPIMESGNFWLIVGMTEVDLDEATPSGLLGWHFSTTHGQDVTTTPGWSVGRSIAISGTSGSGWIIAEETPFLMSITAVTVPEPSSAFGLAGGALLLLRRRYRAKSPLG